MSETPPWIATTATVTSCRFQFARLNTLTLGVQTGEKFRVAFNYYAHGRLYSDEFDSPVAIPQSQCIPLTYDPIEPQRNSLSSGSNARAGRGPLIAIAVAGGIALSLFWLFVLRGCS